MLARSRSDGAGKRCLAWCTLLSTLISGGCNLVYEWAVERGPGQNLEQTIKSLEQANRMIVQQHGGALEHGQVVTDRALISDVLSLFKKYPTGWHSVSGAGGDYDLFLYQDDRLLGRVGLVNSSRIRPGEDTLTVGVDYFRRAPAEEVSALAHRLGLQWPPP